MTSPSARLAFALASCALVLPILAPVATPSALAADVPNTGLAVDLSAREQPIGVFLNALFREIDVPVVVDENVDGSVNGRFDGPVGDILAEIAGAFDVIVYHDGALAHVYPSNALSRRVISTDRAVAARVRDLAERIGLPDASNSLSVESTGLLASGTPRFLAQVDELVEAVERNPPPPRRAASPAPLAEAAAARTEPAPLVYRVFRLRHAWAADTSFTVGGQTVTVPGVATLLGSLVSTRGPGFGEAARETTVEPRTLGGLRGAGLARVGETPDEDAATASLPAIAGGGAAARIVADTRINAVIVRDRADRMTAYQGLIESLDVESRMVEIEATIVDINTDRTRELGINWRYGFERNEASGELSLGDGDARDASLFPGTTPLGTPVGRGGVLSLTLGEPAEFLARVRALEANGAARVVSKPHVITLSDVEAVLGATTEFFVRVAGNDEVDLFNVPVGTLLRVTPHVFSETGRDRIKLLVNIEDGAQSGTDVVDGIPVVERATISTQALIDDGDSLLVGGLVRDAYRQGDNRIPILGSIPFVGRLFRTDRNVSTRVERLFMITPRLADGIGFGGTSGRPALRGDQNRLIADAALRAGAVEWPERETRPWWPEEVEPGTANRLEGEPLAVAVTGGEPLVSAPLPGAAAPAPDAPFVLPAHRLGDFTVEPWEVAR